MTSNIFSSEYNTIQYTHTNTHTHTHTHTHIHTHTHTHTHTHIDRCTVNKETPVYSKYTHDFISFFQFPSIMQTTRILHYFLLFDTSTISVYSVLYYCLLEIYGDFSVAYIIKYLVSSKSIPDTAKFCLIVKRKKTLSFNSWWLS